MSHQPPPGASAGPPSGPEQGWGAPPPGFGPAPGSVPPRGYAGPPPGYAAPRPGYPSAPPGYAPAWGAPPAYKPGVVALRPLRLGDLYDGAFKAIRQNPKTMVGLAALVTTVFMLIPALGSVLLAATGNLMVAPGLADPTAAPGSSSSFQGLGLSVAQGVGGLFSFPATVILTGICVQVVHRAVLGHRTGIAEAWTAARGRLLRLLGLTLLSGLAGLLVLGVPIGLGVLLALTVQMWLGVLVGVLGGLAGLLAFVVLEVRMFYLAPAALVLERTGVMAALRRSWSLTRGQFWRVFGISLLTGLVVGLVGQVLSVPATVISMSAVFIAPDSSWAGLLVVLSGYVSTIVVGAVTTPFLAGVSALLYLDQRIRKEAYDVELIAASQHSAA